MVNYRHVQGSRRANKFVSVSINSVIETIVITIHLETDWNKLQVQSNKNIVPCSPYMRELSQFINRVYNTYLMSFENKEVLSTK